jgi:hypothetical protein
LQPSAANANTQTAPADCPSQCQSGSKAIFHNKMPAAINEASAAVITSAQIDEIGCCFMHQEMSQAG